MSSNPHCPPLTVLRDFCIAEGYRTTATNGKNLLTVSSRGFSMNPSRNFVRKLTLTPESAESVSSCAVLSGSRQERTCSAEDIGTMPNLHLPEGASQYPPRVKHPNGLHPNEAEDRYRAKVPKTLRSVLWENLSSLMEEKKTNMWRLSIDAKVSPATVHKLREKQTSPRLDVLEAIAGALGVEVWQRFSTRCRTNSSGLKRMRSRDLF
jgi:transcriptional regulator with XRE-family HTH domain